MYEIIVVCCCLWCLLLCCLCIVLWLLCVACSCFQLCRMFLYRLITSMTNRTTHTTKNMYVLLMCVDVCAVCFCVVCSLFLCLVCAALSYFQRCRMFLYRLIANKANITKHKTKTHVWFCCCLLLFVLFVHWSVSMLLCFFSLPTMPHVPLQVNNEHNITKHKTQNMYDIIVCCCLCCLFFVLFVHGLCVCVVLLCLVSNYAACSFIG